MNTDPVRTVVRERLTALNLNMADVSRQLGSNHAYLQQFPNRGIPAKLPEDVRGALAALIGVSEATLRASKARAVQPSGSGVSSAANSPDVRPPPSALPPEADLRQILSDGLSANADLPVYASAEGGAEGMVVQADAIEWVKRPAPLANIRRAFAVYVLGDSMSPAYEQGDLLLVNPSVPFQRGDDILLAGDIDNGDMAALVKRLLSWNADAWKVRQFSPTKDFSLSRAAWPKAYVIVGKYRRR